MTPPAHVNAYQHQRCPGEIISHAGWLYFRVPLSPRDVAERLCVRGVLVSYAAIRTWCRKFGHA
jgi:putative transposase